MKFENPFCNKSIKYSKLKPDKTLNARLWTQNCALFLPPMQPFATRPKNWHNWIIFLTTGSMGHQGAIVIEMRKKVSCVPDMFYHLAAFTVAFFISLSPLDPTFGQLIPTISRLNVKRATVVWYDIIIEIEDFVYVRWLFSRPHYGFKIF